MKYCRPLPPLCTYVQWTGYNHKEVESFLDAGKIEYNGWKENGTP